MRQEKEYLHWLLGVPRIGYLRCLRLLNHFGSAETVWEANEADFQNVPSISQKEVSAILTSRQTYSFAEQEQFLKRHSIRLLDRNDPEYPPLLLQIFDPPHLLYIQGELLPEDEHALAVVGSRHPTNYGSLVTNKLTSELAVAGITIVSGLAKGIDALAHEAALQANGRTIAVLAGGLLNLYPSENKPLARRIVQQGALLSEFHPLAPAHPGMFPVRNRIISGISRAVLIMEAARKSGSLITADQAIEQSRDVFAVPGPITSPLSQGTNDLIRQGARLVTGMEDIWEEYPDWRPVSGDLSTASPIPMSPEEKRLLDLIGYGAVHAEHLLRSANLAVGTVYRLLLEMELKGWVKQMPGQMYMKGNV
jgi:DNA processing protein